MIKKVAEIPDEIIKETKMDVAKSDIREIIEKRIKRSKIVKSPFAASSTQECYRRAIRKVIWDIKKEKQTSAVPDWDCIKLIRRTEDGVVNWYIFFDVEKWDKEWKKIAVQEGKA